MHDDTTQFNVITRRTTEVAGGADPTPGDIELLAVLALDARRDRPVLLHFDDDGIIDRRDLLADDPVASLYGETAPDRASAVGLCSPASVSPTHNAATPLEADTVVHVVHRSGLAVTALLSDDGPRWFGPTHQPQHGRVPDTCRRLLRLETAPPTEPMTNFVISAWLELVLRRALEHPGLDWPAIVALHPAATSCPSPVTPSTLAAATISLGTALQWERFRRVIATVGGFPFGENASELAHWMDAGMFSRWAMECVLTRHAALDILESTIGPAVYDRLWATLRLCERDEDHTPS